MLFIGFTSLAQNVEIAIKYNDKILELNEIAISEIEALIDSYDNFIPQQMDSAHSKALFVVDSLIKRTIKLAPFKNDSTFRDSAIKLFKTYKMVLEDEHSWIIKLLKLPAEQYGEEQIKEYKKYVEDANNACEKSTEELVKIQTKFAKKFKFELNTE